MKLRIRFSFLLFNALLFMFRDSSLIFGFYAACIVHELGHLAAIKLTGGCVRTVELSCFGIKIYSDPAVSTLRGVVVLLSGPAADLLLAAILRMVCPGSPAELLSWAEGLLNLLPYSFLDGGAVIDLASAGSPWEALIGYIRTVLACLTTFTIVVCIICAICGISTERLT